MNKTLEFYRKLAEAYKEHGFEDYAVAELWTALEKAVLANAELLEELGNCALQIEYLHDKFHVTGSGNAAIARAREAIRKAKENNDG